MAIVQTVEGDGRRRLRVASPATEQPIGDLPVTTGDEVRAAVTRARRAQPAWEALGFQGRAAFMQKALELLIRRQEESVRRAADAKPGEGRQRLIEKQPTTDGRERLAPAHLASASS